MSKRDREILFVGECRSLTAIRMSWTWKDGRLAAKTLFEALRGMGLDPLAHDFVNLWTDPPLAPCITAHRKAMLRSTKKLIVALGKKVSDGLTNLSIEHVALIHPAARGKIRGRGRYAKHVKKILGPAVTSLKDIA